MLLPYFSPAFTLHFNTLTCQINISVTFKSLRLDVKMSIPGNSNLIFFNFFTCFISDIRQSPDLHSCTRQWQLDGDRKSLFNKSHQPANWRIEFATNGEKMSGCGIAGTFFFRRWKWLRCDLCGPTIGSSWLLTVAQWHISKVYRRRLVNHRKQFRYNSTLYTINPKNCDYVSVCSYEWILGNLDGG